MSYGHLAIVIFLIWAVPDQRSFHWLAWLWLIVVSLPFLLTVSLGLAVMAGWDELQTVVVSRRNLLKRMGRNAPPSSQEP